MALGASFAISVKLIGFLKEMLLASKFGLSEQLDNYLLAMLWVLFLITPVAGAYSTILTPLIVTYQKQQEHRSVLTIVRMFLRAIIKYSLIFLLLCGAILFLFFHYNGELPLFSQNYEFLILLPISVFSGISIVCGGVLIANSKTKTYTALPASVTLCIVCFLILNPTKNPLFALLMGTTIGYLFEAFLNLLAIKKTIFSFDSLIKIDPRVREKIKSQLPLIVLSTTIANGCLLVDQFMASLAGPGGISAISFGNKFSLAIISILAVMWVALYPVFSAHIAEKDFNALSLRLSYWLKLILFVGLPSCMVLAFFSEEIVRVLFERGEFDGQSTTIVAPVQSLYIMHIPFYVVCVICSRISNALHLNQANIVFSSLTLILNVYLNLALVSEYGVYGIALATLVTYLLVSVFWTFWTLTLVKKQLKNA